MRWSLPRCIEIERRCLQQCGARLLRKVSWKLSKSAMYDIQGEKSFVSLGKGLSDLIITTSASSYDTLSGFFRLTKSSEGSGVVDWNMVKQFS